VQPNKFYFYFISTPTITKLDRFPLPNFHRLAQRSDAKTVTSNWGTRTRSSRVGSILTRHRQTCQAATKHPSLFPQRVVNRKSVFIQFFFVCKWRARVHRIFHPTNEDSRPERYKNIFIFNRPASSTVVRMTAEGKKMRLFLYHFYNFLCLYSKYVLLTSLF